MRTLKTGDVAYDCACGGAFRAKAPTLAGVGVAMQALAIFQQVHSGEECHEVSGEEGAKIRHRIRARERSQERRAARGR